jgi:hypothetical protein
MGTVYRPLMLAILSAGVIIGSSNSSVATLTVTPIGMADGFILTLFVDQVPASGYCCGPLGIATNNLGQVVIQDYLLRRNYVFNDVNNQHFSAAISSAPFGSRSFGTAIANSGGTLYAGSQDASSQLFKLNPDGSSAGVVPGTSPGIAGHGIWANPVTGHLVSASGNGIFDVNPATGATMLIVAGDDLDGVSVSADGKTIYGADSGHVFGWNYSGVLVYDSRVIPATPVGTGVIQGNNPFAGDVISNNIDGSVWLLDPKAHTAVEIASGGSRGDYVGIDSNDGSLFLTQTGSVYRLTCVIPCIFQTPAIPEPATIAVLGTGVLIFSLIRRPRADG